MPKNVRSGEFDASLIPLKLRYKKTKQDIKNLRHTLEECYNRLYSSKFEPDISKYRDKTQGKPIYANYLSRDSYVNNGDILVTKMFPYIQAFRKYIIYGGSQLINHKRIVRLKGPVSCLGTLKGQIFRLNFLQYFASMLLVWIHFEACGGNDVFTVLFCENNKIQFFTTQS